MTDYVGFIIQGFFTGLGVASANWFHERHLLKKLEVVEKEIVKVKNLRGG